MLRRNFFSFLTVPLLLNKKDNSEILENDIPTLKKIEHIIKLQIDPIQSNDLFYIKEYADPH